MHSELCPSLKARDAKGPSSDGDGDGAILVPMVQPIATHDVAGTMLSRNTSGGFSNSIDHAAAGYMALQPIAIAENTIGRKPENGGNGDGFTEEGPMYTLNATGVHGVAQAIPIDTMNHVGRGDKHSMGDFVPGAPSYTLTKGHSHAVAQPTIVHGTQDPCVSDIAFAQGRNNDGENVMVQAMAVRRLTPKECERLQGFPDNYTDIKPKGKATPDGPRYKALGNSMAVPVMAWIGKRIQEVDAICQTQKQ
jgi:DNA (cytosine-5)-methyltransferase 1